MGVMRLGLHDLEFGRVESDLLGEGPERVARWMIFMASACSAGVKPRNRTRTLRPYMRFASVGAIERKAGPEPP